MDGDADADEVLEGDAEDAVEEVNGVAVAGEEEEEDEIDDCRFCRPSSSITPV